MAVGRLGTITGLWSSVRVQSEADRWDSDPEIAITAPNAAFAASRWENKSIFWEAMSEKELPRS
jgi:hypothetical protein